MRRLQSQLLGFQAALMAPVTGARSNASLVTTVSAYVRSIERRIRFVELHSAVLNGVDWDRVESIGRCLPGVSQPNHLTISLADASLTIQHAEAVIDHVYVAFDGLTAAVVNITDTMGRLLNARYAVGIDPKRASLLSLKNHCAPMSPLASVINAPLHSEWLKSVRELRGRCQHADVEQVVVAAEGPFGRRGQPIILPGYCWQTPPKALPIVDYCQEAAQAAENTLLAVIGAVISAPNNPLV